MHASSRLREETPVSSGAVAFDLVRRESVWQRAGPLEGVSPRTSPYRIPGLPGAGRTQDHHGGPRPGSAEEVAGNRSDGTTFGPLQPRTLQWVIPPEPKPHERDRMKHAGQPRRGVTRQGREKRRRRNEASVETRDEESGPIGTCTPTILFGGAPGAVSQPPSSIATSLGFSRTTRRLADDRWSFTLGPAPDRVSTATWRGCPLRGAPAPYHRTDPEWTGRDGTKQAARGPRGRPSPDGRTHGSRFYPTRDLGPDSSAGTRCTRDAPSFG